MTGTPGITRRQIIASAGSAGVGFAIGAGVGDLARPDGKDRSDERVPFHGPHQAGIATPPPNHLHFAAFDVKSDRLDDLRELLLAWTRACERLTAGEPLQRTGSHLSGSPVDTGEAAESGPAVALTLTIGFGPTLFMSADGDRLGLARSRPAPLVELPAFRGESLNRARSGGDLCIQACATDPQVAFHAIHNLVRVGAATASLRWTQTGFNRAATTSRTQSTPRNLMGFKDGTNNLRADDANAMQEHVWVGREDRPRWMHDGTYLVVRRIRTLLDVWDASSLADQEATIGRHKRTGAPLGASREHDPVDLGARIAGAPAIPFDAHIRLAAPAENDGRRLLRRGYSFSDGTDVDSGQLDAGLFFACFQRDPREQFVSLQRRLATDDALNRHILHTASAVFAIPPGAAPGGYVGETLFASVGS